jgi:hypothetical protein
MPDKPPLPSDFLKITPQPKVTFEELDEAMSSVEGILPAAYAIGVIYGSVCAPHLEPPSVYLPEILGRKMELPDPTVASRILSLLHSLHNQLAEMVEDNEPLYVRRKDYSRDKAGILLRGRELQQEAAGFQEGLFSGVDTKGDLPKACAEHIAQLVLDQRYLTSFDRSVRATKAPLDGEDLQRRHQELEARSASITHAMRSISHVLYLTRMKKYKAQGVVRIGRNDPCPCGSGKKFKNCCMDKIKPTDARNN